MRGVRTISISALVGFALLGIRPVPAAAGGWDSLQFGHHFYLPGDTAVTRTRFDSSVHYGGRPSDGPFYAYLLSKGPEFAIIDPPSIPKGAVKLGAIGIAASGRPDGSFDLIAHLSFTVPDLPSRRYAIGICNDPCRDSGIDDLNGGSIQIVHTQLEGQLTTKVGKLEGELRSLRYHLRKSDKLSTQLRAKVTAGQDAADALRGQVAALRTRRRAATQPREAHPLIGTTAAFAVAAAIALLALTLLTRRRRPRRSGVTLAPNTSSARGDDEPGGPDFVDTLPPRSAG